MLLLVGGVLRPIVDLTLLILLFLVEELKHRVKAVAVESDGEELSALKNELVVHVFIQLKVVSFEEVLN